MLLTKNKYIVFIGDSFCANTEEKLPDYKVNGVWRPHREKINYPSIVADHYGYRIIAHGYPGKGWWYSRAKFFKQLERNPKILDNIDAMVFCHTDGHRINSDNDYTIPWNFYGERPDSSYKNLEDREVARAQALWVKYLLDIDFQEWAQLNWFREITREWSHIKQVHFHCFPWTVPNDHLLTGQRFTTPLVHISLGELSGTVAEIEEQLCDDKGRVNHLSHDNNRVLAQIIIDALNNYKNQSQPLDMSKFKNIVNQNYDNYPNGNYGTC